MPQSEIGADPDGVKASNAALAEAIAMPAGPERIAALKEAGRLRYEAYERRRIRQVEKLLDQKQE